MTNPEISTSASAKSVNFVIRTGPVTILGITYVSGESFALSAPNNGTLSPIAYDATGGSLIITTLV
jgi:hypothetical protein